MRVEKIELNSFRGFAAESFTINNLTVFSGEMGTGKTSRLLSILFCLTGRAPRGLNLDDLINADSDFMWVRAIISQGSSTHFIERRKRRNSSTTAKTDFSAMPDPEGTLYMEGREVANLFAGAPMEKALKLDVLLGLSEYDQRASEIISSPVERRIRDLNTMREKIEQARSSAGRLKVIAEKIEVHLKKRDRIRWEIQSLEREYINAEDVLRREDEARRNEATLESKRNLIRDYMQRLAEIPPPSPTIEQELREHEAKWDALQRRRTFLEAAMETLKIEGKDVRDLKLCPLCGALLTPNALDTFRHYDTDYKRVLTEIMTFREMLEEKRREESQAKKDRERSAILSSELAQLQREIASLSSNRVTPGVAEAKSAVQRYESLKLSLNQTEAEMKSLEEQRTTLEVIQSDLMDAGYVDLDLKIKRLEKLAGDLKAVKDAMVEVISEFRSKRMKGLRDSFRNAFRDVYPYERFSDVDFETSSSRGWEVLVPKAMVNDNWILASQMSTGENVALGFALLFAINRFEKSQVMLLDEPEEGLDENGIKGLADLLLKMKKETQIVVASRSPLLARLLMGG